MEQTTGPMRVATGSERPRRLDPLAELFRPTTPQADPVIGSSSWSAVRLSADADQLSAAPVRRPGTRARAGNAMSRTRAALFEGARQAVIASGTKISMSQVATEAGVAKATLYNHFRTREAVLGALLRDEVESIIADCAGRSPFDALQRAAGLISTHPVLRALERHEPATLAALSRVSFTDPNWALVRTAVTELLAEHDLAGASTVVRWLASFVVSPGEPAAVSADLDVLLAGLPPLTRGAGAAPGTFAGTTTARRDSA